LSVVVFAAYEAGAAAAMAPVWHRLGTGASTALSPVAARYLGYTPDYLLDDTTSGDDFFGAAPGAIVLSATGRSEEADILFHARERGIPVLQLIETWLAQPGSYAGRFCGAMADVIGVVDGNAQRDAIAEGVPGERIRVLGNPAWEQASPQQDARRTRVAYIIQPLRKLFGTALGYDEVSGLEMLHQARAARPDLIEEIVVVPHPAGDACVDVANQMPLLQALAGCGTIVGVFSSALTDAVLGGRTVISIQPHASTDICGLSRRGVIPCATTVAQLCAHLESASPSPRAGDLRAAVQESAARVLNVVNSLVCA
jgi:hypothetical protein